MNEYKLQARFDRRNEFYGKAVVREQDNGDSVLFSYGTKVAEIKNSKLIIHGWYSQTTARHINEFAVQNGFKSMSKKEMIEYNND